MPNQLTQSGAPLRVITEITPTAFYAQDSWSVRRFTLQGGVRYDHQSQAFPDQTVGYTRFIPNAFLIPASKGMHFNDITPRMAVACDLSGNGKTAVKVTLGKYVLAQDGGGVFGADLNPVQRLATSINRSWSDANRDFVPDCDLLSPVANGECGAISDRNFGQNVYSSSYDPAVIKGWGVRPYQWEFSSSIQHEIVPRVGVSVGYSRRWFGNFVVTDNLAVTSSDFDEFTLAVPSDPRLPGGGGTVTGVNVTPEKFGLVNNYVTSAANYGKQIEHFNGIDVNVNVRTATGLTLQGGLSTGKTTTDNCEIADKLPETLLSATLLGTANNNVWQAKEFCHQESPFLTQFKGLGSYTLPKIDVLVSGTFQSSYGGVLAANFNAPNALVAPSLGRPLSGNAANVAINLAEPGNAYGDRINQIDLRVAKVFRFGVRRAQVGMDLYNALDANTIQTYNQTFGANYLTPTLILPARFAKFSVQLDF